MELVRCKSESVAELKGNKGTSSLFTLVALVTGEGALKSFEARPVFLPTRTRALVDKGGHLLGGKRVLGSQ